MSYLPPWEQVWRVLTLSDFNTRVVVVGVALLGMAAGIIGTFTLLRKRALVSDAVSHATLPGIAAAWLVMVALGGTGKWFPGLLLGAAAGGLAAVAAVLVVRSVLRLHEDAALGIVLSVSFGIGIALLGVIQQMRRGSAAGLDSFIYGKTASMLVADATLIGITSLVLVVVAVLLFKELNLLCFDAAYAASQGLPVGLLDAAMLALVVAVTVIGLQAVGLILIVALLITSGRCRPLLDLRSAADDDSCRAARGCPRLRRCRPLRAGAASAGRCRDRGDDRGRVSCQCPVRHPARPPAAAPGAAPRRPAHPPRAPAAGRVRAGGGTARGYPGPRRSGGGRGQPGRSGAAPGVDACATRGRPAPRTPGRGGCARRRPPGRCA